MVADAAHGSRTRSLKRHLEGWQLGLLAVAIPVVALWLALPRPVPPRLVPLPEPDRAEVSRLREIDGQRADRVKTEPLSFAVRHVGETLRQYGSARDHADAARLRAEVRSRFRLARREEKAGEGLLRLRAVQTRLFEESVERWQRTGKADRELVELAGNFEERARRSGWVGQDGRLAFSSAELFVLYRVRWTELVGALDDTEFRPTLQELRAYYRALMSHPEGANELERDSSRLAYVGALQKRDGEYPASLARGVLHYRLGQRAAAAAAFEEHLAANPDGPYALRARNHLLAALAGASPAE